MLAPMSTVIGDFETFVGRTLFINIANKVRDVECGKQFFFESSRACVSCFSVPFSALK